MLDLPRKIIGLQLKMAKAVAAAVTGAGAKEPPPANPLRPDAGHGAISGAPGMRDGASYDPASPAARPQAGAATVRVTFDNLGVGADVAPGTTILEAAMAARIELNHYCGGMASCGSCRIEVVEGADHVSPMEPMEEPTLDMVKENPGDRLGCQTRIHSNITIKIPPQD